MSTLDPLIQQRVDAVTQAIEQARVDGERILEDLRREMAVARVSRIVARERVEALVRDSELADEDVEVMAEVLRQWDPEDAFDVGDVRAWDGEIWICQQAHQGQIDWTPDVAVSLWARYRQEQEVLPWVQPDGAGGPNLPYGEGERVTHQGRIWRSLVPDNVWEPGTVEGLWEDEGEA